MKNKRTACSVLFLLGLLPLLLGACLSAEAPSRLQEIQDSGELLVGTALTPPFEFRDAEGSELKGLDVDLANAIAAKIGVPVVWKEMPFADLVPALQESKVDMLIAGMYITDGRKELMDMSDGYVDTGLVAVSQANTTRLANAQGMADKIVCVKTGSTGALYAQTQLDSGVLFKIQEYADTPSSLADLSMGFCDFALNDRINSLEYFKTHPGLQLASDVLEPAWIGAAVKKGDTELLGFINTTIRAMQADGSLKKLQVTWIPEN